MESQASVDFVTRDDNRLIVPICIGSANSKGLIDSGALNSLINREWLKENNFPLQSAEQEFVRGT